MCRGQCPRAVTKLTNLAPKSSSLGPRPRQRSKLNRTKQPPVAYEPTLYFIFWKNVRRRLHLLVCCQRPFDQFFNCWQTQDCLPARVLWRLPWLICKPLITDIERYWISVRLRSAYRHLASYNTDRFRPVWRPFFRFLWLTMANAEGGGSASVGRLNMSVPIRPRSPKLGGHGLETK